MNSFKSLQVEKFRYIPFLFSIILFSIAGNGQDCRDCIPMTVQWVGEGSVISKIEVIQVCFLPQNAINPHQFETRRSEERNDAVFEKGIVIKKNGDTLDCFLELPGDKSYIEYKMACYPRSRCIGLRRIKKIITPYITFERIQQGRKTKLVRTR